MGRCKLDKVSRWLTIIVLPSSLLLLIKRLLPPTLLLLLIILLLILILSSYKSLYVVCVSWKDYRHLSWLCMSDSANYFALLLLFSSSPFSVASLPYLFYSSLMLLLLLLLSFALLLVASSGIGVQIVSWGTDGLRNVNFFTPVSLPLPSTCTTPC